MNLEFKIIGPGSIYWALRQGVDLAYLLIGHPPGDKSLAGIGEGTPHIPVIQTESTCWLSSSTCG
jgi:hypothetical protein